MSDPAPDRRIPGFLFVILLVLILGGVAYALVSVAQGEPG